jgi:hypothetical protein
VALTVNASVNPIKITGTTATDQEILSSDKGITHVKFIRWYNPSSAGHFCHVTDGSGNTIVKMNAEAANDTQMWPIYSSYFGIRCDDLDSGELYIHIT